VPQWQNRLFDYQLETILLVLDQEDLLFFSNTGCGKVALFITSLLVHQKLYACPSLYPPFLVKKNPVAIVVTPTKGLVNSIV
ncbi:hypothetical protein K435DRAFT_560600, partial [Dendrothele bispora CBS 962.96]